MKSSENVVIHYDDISQENAHANTLSSIRIQAEQRGLLLENEIDEVLNMVLPATDEFQLHASLDGRAFRLDDPIATKHILRHTFQAFYTEDSAHVSRRNVQRSSGAGLAITKSVVEAPEEEIWVPSAPAAGTTIHFTTLETAQCYASRRR